MQGDIGRYLMSAAHGSTVAKEHLKGIFGQDFQTWGGWTEMLDHLPGGSVELMLKRRGAWWTRECFQALYVACWIDHPVEKGSYMIKLDPTQYENVKDAYTKLLASGELQSRISSHLSKQGASAHEGWNFLRGYAELLLQIEGAEHSAPYLFLKCEGHSLNGFAAIHHLRSWAVKIRTGQGIMASPELHDWASNGGKHMVEERAAENFSKDYEKLLKQLGLSSRKTTVEEAIDTLVRKAGFPDGIPNHVKRDSQQLGRAMQGQGGYIALLLKRKDILKQKKVDFNDDTAAELEKIAQRMASSTTPHEQQHFHEVRVTPSELDRSLAQFRSFIV